MRSQYNPKSALRQTSNKFLREFFEKEGQPLAVEWDKLGEGQIDAIFDAWQHLPPDARRKIEVGLHEVCDMADEDGIRVIVEEARNREDDIATYLDAMESRHDKAMWTLLNRPGIWNAAVLFARADSLSHGRCWVKRGNMPDATPQTDSATIKRFSEAVSGFFRERQARGHNCHVDYLARGKDQDYFFVYLSDYADTHINFDDRGALTRTAERRAFEVVFAFDRSSRTLDLFAKGGKAVVQPLQEIFARVILGTRLDIESPTGRPYQLDHLMDRSFGFPFDPADSIVEVRLKSIRLSMVGMRRGRITLDPQPDDPPSRIYDMLDEDLDQKRLPRSVLHVTKATIGVRLNGGTRRKTLTINLSWPDRCDLKSKPEELRELGEKYLREWKINVA